MVARFVRPVLLVAATAALGACSTYGGYGSTRVGVGVGYSSGGYYPYGRSYSRYPYYGWYDGYYYPGTGYYIYDRHGARHRWSDRHRRHWEARRGDRRGGENWSGYRDDGRRADRDRGRGEWRNRDQRGDGDRRGWQRGSGREAPVAGSRPQVRQPAPRVDRSPQRSERAERRVDRGREFRRGSRDRRADD